MVAQAHSVGQQTRLHCAALQVYIGADGQGCCLASTACSKRAATDPASVFPHIHIKGCIGRKVESGGSSWGEMRDAATHC